MNLVTQKVLISCWQKLFTCYNKSIKKRKELQNNEYYQNNWTSKQ